MSKKDGPAFPSSYVEIGSGAQWIAHGMSLRDYFAGQAVIGCGGWPGNGIADVGDNFAMVAVFAYKVADALLAERAKAEARP
jgi:hypothetical protein